MDTPYNPTAGEQKMLGDFNNRMADINRVAQSSAGTVIEDPIERENAEKTARWGIENAASEAHYSRRQAGGVDSQVAAYEQAFGTNPDLRKNLDQRLRFGYAEGGKIDPEEMMRQMAAKYGAPTAGPSKQAPAPQTAQQPAPQQQTAGSLLVGATNALKNRAAQIEKATAGYARGGEIKGPAAEAMNVKAHRQAMRAADSAAQGGKIQGPGTATSDSIPAKVAETGEDILVSSGERIISAEQEILLRRIADMLGFETVDAMLEAGTGKPVGPTIRKGKRAAATGGQFDGDRAWYAGTDSRDERTGLEMERARRAAAPAEVLASDPVKSALKYGVVGSPPAAAAPNYGNEGRSVPQPVTDAAKHPVSVPASRAAGSMLLGAELIDNTPTHPLTTKDIANGGFIDRGAGILAQRGQNGRLNVTNVDTGGLTDPSKRSIDDSASALLDQKGSTYNPAAQLERMQRSRMMGDLTDPTITDPSVRQQAAVALTAMNNGRQGEAQANLQGAQAGLVRANTEQAQQMETMRGKLLDPNTPPAERERMIQALQAINGKTEKQTNLQAIDVEEPIDPKQPLLGNRKVPYVFDPRTGQSRPMMQQAQPTDPMSQAKAAIARGADPKAVNARLRQLGLPEVK